MVQTDSNLPRLPHIHFDGQVCTYSASKDLTRRINSRWQIPEFKQSCSLSLLLLSIYLRETSLHRKSKKNKTHLVACPWLAIRKPCRSFSAVQQRMKSSGLRYSSGFWLRGVSGDKDFVKCSHAFSRSSLHRLCKNYHVLTASSTLLFS
jgi:hypothetical protein